MLTVPTFSKNGNLQVIIETPKGSQNKYFYDPQTGYFKLKKILPDGLSFPLDFGFVPGTQAEDGDPVDALVIMEKHTYPGCLLECKILGIMEASQKEKGSKKIRNDGLIVFPIDDLEHFKFRTLDNMIADMLTELVIFFEDYNKAGGKVFKFLGYKDAKTAMKVVKKSITD